MPAGCVQHYDLTASEGAEAVSTLDQRREFQRPRGLHDLTPDLARSAADGGGACSLGARLRQSIAANAIPTVATLVLVWLATVSLVVINYFIPFNFVTLVYMLPVVVAATQWGVWPGIVAAITGAAAADFFFYPPVYTFWIRDPQNVIDLVLFLLIALVTSNLAARLKNEAVNLRRREREIGELHAFSQRLATCLTGRDLIFAMQDYLSHALRYRAVLIATASDGEAPDDGVPPDGVPPDGVPPEIRRAALVLIKADALQGSTIEAHDGKAWLLRVIAPEILGYGAIAVEVGDSPVEITGAVAKRVEAVLDEVMVTFKHLKIKEAIENAKISYQTEVLRDALVGGVSHELRSPLASIIGSCSVLNEMPAVVNDRRASALVDAIGDQAGQLDSEIRDLLNAGRITAKGVLPQLAWTDPTDIVSAALRQKERRLASHRITLDVAADVPLVHVDSALVEQALGQLLENAAKYSPSSSEIKIVSRCEQNCVVLSVQDQGGGLTADELGQLGRRSFRGQSHAAAPSGSGLGLWIASTFIAANGGTLHAESPGPDRGATLSLRLPTVLSDAPELADMLDD